MIWKIVADTDQARSFQYSNWFFLIYKTVYLIIISGSFVATKAMTTIQ